MAKEEKDTRSSRTKMIEEIPTQNLMTRGAAKVSRVLDKMGFTQEDKYKDKKYGEQKKASGGTIKAKEGKWIQSAVKKPGALREQLGVKGKKPIPAKMLDKATKAPGKLGQRARLAKTLKGMK
jgi:uncharacterized protein RhaS with RHS repeats